jgi:hypothetical protein
VHLLCDGDEPGPVRIEDGVRHTSVLYTSVPRLGEYQVLAVDLT